MSDRVTSNPESIPAGRHRPALIRFVAAAIVLLAVDLVVKHLSFELVAGGPVDLAAREPGEPVLIPPHEAIALVPGVLSLHLTTNEGAVFGLGQGGRWFFIPFSVIAVAVIGRVFWSSRHDAPLLHLALSAVLAGALGNLYDRMTFAAVRDMFWLFPGVKLPFGWRWPGGSDELYPWIFNVADVALVVGVLVLVLMMMRKRPA